MERCPQQAASILHPPFYDLALDLALFLGANATHTLEILEELGIWIHDHQVMPILETGAIRLKTTIELVKLGVLPERLGIHLGRLGVARTADLFGIAIGFCQDHDTLAIGIGADLFRFSGAG